MPMYDVYCAKCDQKYEVILKQPPLGVDIMCPVCQATASKLMTAPSSFIIKGLAARNGYHIPRCEDD